MRGREEPQQQEQPTRTCCSSSYSRSARRRRRTTMAVAAPQQLSSLLALLVAVAIVLLAHDDPRQSSLPAALFVHSFPFGAGGCRGGEAAVGGAHLNSTIRPIIRGASLSEGGFVVAIDGVPLGTTIERFDLNTDYAISVTATEYAYKGCLIRLEALDGQDTTAALTPGLNTGPATVCEAPVVGITHVVPIFKQVHSGTINLSEQGEIALDVTIVGLNNETASLYAYDGFRVQFGDPPAADPVTAAPVTEAPTTAAPATQEPSMAAPLPGVPATPRPIVMVTRSPVASPDGDNATTPETLAPTIAPATVAPTAAPVATEAPSTAAPSTAAPSTEAPADAPPPSSPTGTPSQVPDAEEPQPTGTPVTQIVQNMVLTLRGVKRELTLFELGEWETVTEAWFNDFFNDDKRSSRRNLQAAGQKYGVVSGSMTNMIQLISDSLDEENQEFTIVYDHGYSYEKTDDATVGPLQYATLPFRSTSASAAYREELQTRLRDALDADTGLLVVSVPQIGGPNYGKDPDDDGLSGGAVAGICVAVLSVVGGVGLVAYKKRADFLEKKKAATAVQNAQAIDKDAFSFDAAVAPANASFQSNSNNNNNENVASTSGVPGLGAKPMASFDPELLYTVYAPKGKLGIVLENPDNEGPLVYIIRESSPLRDKMEVGDRLIAVDEVDVRSMSPVKISKLISKRSANPVRKMTLLKIPPKSEEDDDETGKEQQQTEAGAEEEKEADRDDVDIMAENPKDREMGVDVPEDTPEVVSEAL